MKKSSDDLFFLLYLKIFLEEQLAEQFGYFSLYLVIFRAEQWEKNILYVV